MRTTHPILAGMAGTAAMTAMMYMAPLMGLPNMNVPAMLSMMLGAPLIIGWLMHAMIGVAFALLYARLFHRAVKNIGNPVVRGLLFGTVVFLLAQVVMAMMTRMMGAAPAPAGGMLPMMIGSLIGHLVYGTVVATLLNPAARAAHS